MTAARPDWSHIYLDVLTPLPLGAAQDESRVAAALRAAAASITAKCSAQLRRAAIAQWEVKLRVSDKTGSAWHVIVSVPTGHEGGEDCVDLYREQPSADGSGLVYISKDSFALGRTSTASNVSSLDGTSIYAPYPPLERLQQKRLAARRHKTTYCYDFPAVFENALREIWAARAAAGEPNAVPPAARLVEVQELVPDAGETLSFRQRTALVPSTRPMSQNSVGVVAWVLTLRTPECPQGRQIVAIANDITHASGAFGPAEDAMFRAATEFALEEKLPVVYLAANSGARVGLANEVKQCLQVEWTNPAEPSKGFKYLYLSPEDYNNISKRAAAAGSGPALLARKLFTDAGEERYEITDIVGLEDGLGVECLSGSGAIAGIYAKAFREGFTVTLVSGRTVGIGAYLARLGRRCVQREDQPIILTGYAALNKLLGRDVYTSHMQLGGPKVMGQNGVSHHIVEDDLAGVLCVLRWLSYTAARVGESPPRLPTSDPDTRPVSYLVEEGTKLDPRAAIAGRPSVSAPGGWESGMFDRGSWTEAHPGWARTVVTGRARLAGQPVGVIAVEVSTISLNLPADPGMPDSSERIVPQAGQVWFPDSALKTAQAMEEFDLEKLPLFVLANWRGFSGGQRDLFEGVLQAGSLIVDSLRTYGQPVVMYIPPGCELRGGAWVVIDSQINCEQIESYADPTAKGAVLEPDGVVEIKFRPAELLTIMHKIDPVILKLKQEGAGPGDAAIKARETVLMPVYHQVALAFAQMHDTPQRMMAKGVLRGVVPWIKSRAFFSARLRRRMAEESLLCHIKAADSEVSRGNAVSMLRSWFNSSFSAGNVVNVSGRKNESEEAIAHVQLAAASAAVTNISSSSTITSSNSSSTSSLGEKEMAWENDGAFMSWVESASGAARIAIELKALKQRAATAVVTELAATAEGTNGLIRGLAEAVRSNPSLVLQLRSLVNP
jgi:acetyl-CoA carboxylase/biotin carboxylase 1